MQTGLKLATLGLVASLITLIWLGRINRTLASDNLALTRRNAELRSELKLASQRAAQVSRDAVELDTQLGATKTILSERSRRQAILVAEIDALCQASAQPAAPAQRVDYQHRISELESQLTALLTRALAEPAPTPPPVEAPVLEVVRVAPDDAFVILNGGTEDGLSPGQILSLHRGTSRVARVQISDARARRSVAQVLPGTQKGKLQTGDIVLLTP